MGCGFRVQGPSKKSPNNGSLLGNRVQLATLTDQCHCQRVSIQQTFITRRSQTHLIVSPPGHPPEAQLLAYSSRGLGVLRAARCCRAACCLEFKGLGFGELGAQGYIRCKVQG